MNASWEDSREITLAVLQKSAPAYTLGLRSNSAMESTQDTLNNKVDQRLTDLEIKASFTEDLLEQLDKVIVRQQQQIDLLLREITELRQPATDGASSMPGSTRNLRDDLPPHF